MLASLNKSLSGFMAHLSCTSMNVIIYTVYIYIFIYIYIYLGLRSDSDSLRHKQILKPLIFRQPLLKSLILNISTVGIWNAQFSTLLSHVFFVCVFPLWRFMTSIHHTWRIIPISKRLVTPIYKPLPFSPFGSWWPSNVLLLSMANLCGRMGVKVRFVIRSTGRSKHVKTSIFFWCL